MSKINFTNSDNSIQFSIDEETLLSFFKTHHEVQELNGIENENYLMNFSIHLDLNTSKIDINPFPISLDLGT